jgi:hypothetical protein
MPLIPEPGGRKVGKISGPLLRSNLTRTENLAFETDLLYIDHLGLHVGIRKDNPIRDFDINGISNTTDIISENSVTFGNMLFTRDSISTLSGTISITSGGVIETPELRVGDLYFNNNVLGSYTTNSDILLTANGTGEISIPSNLEVFGSIHATGDITADGSIILGSGDEDNVSFGADIASDIIPDSTSTAATAAVITSGSCPETWAVPRTLSVIGTLNGKNYYNYFDEYLEWTGTYWKYWNTTVGAGAYYRSDDNTTYPWQATTWTAVGVGTPVPIFSQQSGTGYNLGRSDKRWAPYEGKEGNVANNILVGDNISFAGITVNLGIENTWYVSTNGVDTNPGDHPNFAFATVTEALSAAQSAGGNNLIYIMPGTYTEIFPLTVPANTTVRGQSLRSVKIQPTVSTNDKDAFLLNEGCLISDLTVTNFYYDSIGDTGYAFRFANNINVTAKSPYIQNVTVITAGSVTSGSDPRGFDEGDAGRGALVDGSVANSVSNQASMLFNAVTLITPGVDAVTMTNGVRVEFIDSFTYFANRSLYATNGSLGFASLGVTFGAEVRVIASASVYGNIGAEADGDQTLMYLINHNMAYIGSGKDLNNDISLVDQTKETIELNSGKIYYQSQDQSGNYRVGDVFEVNFDTGFVNLAPGSFDFTGSSLTVGVPGTQTYIDAERITLPNFTISGNTIKSDINEVNIASSNGLVNFLTNTNFTNDLTVSGDVTVGGSLINLGNQVTDTIDFEMEFISDIIPAVDNVYNLGQGSGGSLTFSSSNYLSLSAPQTIGTQAFTFECFFYTASNGLQTILGASSTGGMSIWLLGDGTNPVTTIQIDRSYVDAAQYTVSPITINTWHHIAVTRDSSNNMSVFLDGVKATGSTSNATDYTAPSGFIGAVAGSAYYFTGYLTQIKLAVGSNYYNPTASSISVPTTSLTTSANTKLLLTVATSGAYLTDISGTQTISNIGVVTYGTVSPFTALNWDNVYTRQFDVGDITITDNYIAVNQSNEDLLIQANGTGRVVVDNLRFKTQLDSSSGNINLNSGSLSTVFTGNAVTLAKGNSSQRPSIISDFRYNTQTNEFEGYNSASVLMGGVRDLDQNTRIEINSDQFYFYANGTNIGRLDTAGNLIVNKFSSQNQFALDGNTVTVGSVTPGVTAGLFASGTGSVVIDTSNYSFRNNSLVNTVLNSDLQFIMTGVQKEQKVVFEANQKGVKVPYGNTASRNTGRIGELYWNTQTVRLEVFTGTSWISAVGAFSTEVTAEDANDLNVIYELILS